MAFFGSLKFLSYMTLVIIVWLVLNSLSVTHAIHFDRYPFILLNLAFTTQATYAAPLILLSQNRQANTTASGPRPTRDQRACPGGHPEHPAAAARRLG